MKKYIRKCMLFLCGLLIIIPVSSYAETSSPSPIYKEYTEYCTASKVTVKSGKHTYKKSIKKTINLKKYKRRTNYIYITTLKNVKIKSSSSHIKVKRIKKNKNSLVYRITVRRGGKVSGTVKIRKTGYKTTTLKIRQR